MGRRGASECCTWIGGRVGSNELNDCLAIADLRSGSAGPQGVPGDDARVWCRAKEELVYRQSWATRAQARSAIVDDIEVFDIRQRLHSSLGYRPSRPPTRPTPAGPGGPAGTG